MISVLMGAHRVDDFLFEAVDSIRVQRDVTVELIVVANGPACSEVAEAVTARYRDDPRVKVYRTPVGQLAHALNFGLSVASYDVIARMDADDISHPDRLCRQLAFLNASGCDLIGCAARLIDTRGTVVGTRVSPRGAAIRRKLPFRNCFVHPTVMARKNVLLEAHGYSGGFNCEDYDLWLRLRRMGVKWDNMDDVLLDYRVHGGSTQRRLLGYSETAGLMVRELLLTKNPVWLLGAIVAFVKALVRSR